MGMGQGQREPNCGAPSTAEGWFGHPPLVIRLELCSPCKTAGCCKHDMDSFTGDWLFFCTLSPSKKLEACYFSDAWSLLAGGMEF